MSAPNLGLLLEIHLLSAMHNVQRRRGSVGTSQLFDNIVSTSNCTFDGFWDV